MQNVPSTLPGVADPAFPPNRCCGHRRSSSLPVVPVNDDQSAVNGKGNEGDENTKQNGEKYSVDLSGLADTFNQISESLSRPINNLLELLDHANKNLENPSVSNGEDAKDGFSAGRRIQTALTQLNTIQGNVKHVLPHMETILRDYKTTKERTQSRDEMLKTLDKALRRSEGRNRVLHGELQDARDENKCLKEKAQQNESILRYLNTGKDEPIAEKGKKREKQKKEDRGSKRVTREKGGDDIIKEIRSDSVGNLPRPEESVLVETAVVDYPKQGTAVNDDIEAKLGHLQKVLCDYENQLREVIQLNKELVLKINERESEVMSLNRELAKHQETLAIYEKGFKNLTHGNSEMDASLREERAKNFDLRDKLEDSEEYISCITDKVASYEVELKYLREQLRKQDEKIA